MADDRLSSSLDVTCPEMPITKRSLIDLPEDYTDLLNKATAYECPNWSTDRKSKSFAICLTCGDLVCYEVSLIKDLVWVSFDEIWYIFRFFFHVVFNT